MGNVVSPAKIPKVTKLKQIVHILVEQQRKIKRSKQEAMRRQRQVHVKMKNSMSRKTEKRWTDVGIDDDIREMAEEIAYQRNRVLDLKVCVDTLRNLQYKVQSILNAYYTHTTLMIVNNAIKKTNIMVENLDKYQGKFMSNMANSNDIRMQRKCSHALRSFFFSFRSSCRMRRVCIPCTFWILSKPLRNRMCR